MGKDVDVHAGGAAAATSEPAPLAASSAVAAASTSAPAAADREGKLHDTAIGCAPALCMQCAMKLRGMAECSTVTCVAVVPSRKVAYGQPVELEAAHSGEEPGASLPSAAAAAAARSRVRAIYALAFDPGFLVNDSLSASLPSLTKYIYPSGLYD